MSLLELTTAELHQKIEAELARNPALELLEERRCPTCQRVLARRAPCPACTNPRGSTPDQPIVFLSPQQDFSDRYPVADYRAASAASDFLDDNLAPARENLAQYVLRQIAPDLQPDDRPLAAHILTSLDEDGLLSVHPREIALYQHVSLKRVEQVLRLIQLADPLGVGSPSPQEALLVQLEMLNETHPAPAGCPGNPTRPGTQFHRRYLS
jgi:RNA polymerase sigma-54 factor